MGERRRQNEPVPKAKLNPEEELLSSRFANHSQERVARGGRLRLTSERLLFHPHLFDRLLGGRDLDLQRADVVDVDVAPRTGGRFDGGRRHRLRIRLRDGSVELFVVNDVKDVVEELSTRLPGK
jgi:hypothetical protein